MSILESPPARPASLADEIAYRLQRDILERRIGLGEHLAQDELCARFGVSRTPVREALSRLAASSLVELRPNRGAVVRRPGEREIRELYELRAELEGFAAERAASASPAGMYHTSGRGSRTAGPAESGEDESGATARRRTSS